MKSMNRFATISLVTLAASLTLTGCNMGSFPEASANPEQGSFGAIQGSNMGGHAPLVGTHIYMVEPGQAGYGSVVKNLLTTSSNASFPVTKNGQWKGTGYASDQFVPTSDASGNPFYGVTTDATGSFFITNDYTCDVGRPVYLIGYGGSPTSVTGNTFPVISGIVNDNGSTGGTFSYNVNSSTPENFIAGETVSVTTTNAEFAQSGVVLSAGLSTTTFEIFVPYNTTYTGGTTVAVLSGTGASVVGSFFNPGVVNVAMLGNCPSSGNFSTSGNGALSYIYMNEVSSAAAAYVLAPYANTSTGITNNTGMDEFHVGSPSSYQGTLGIYEAAQNASNLYNIQGGGGISTVYDGEGHIANSVTTAGNGTVPQAELDTLGNILAACVDSSNTYRVGTSSTGTLSAACNTLFTYASDNGVYDTTSGNLPSSTTGHSAENTFQAATNMARFPQGAGTGTTSGTTQTVTPYSSTSASNFVSGLYALESGAVPFTPNLHSTGSGTPNNFVVSIVISGNGLSNPFGIAIDNYNRPWVVNMNNNSVSLFQSTGDTYLNPSGNGLIDPNNIAIDTSGNAWVGNQPTTSGYATTSVFDGNGNAKTQIDTGIGYGFQNGGIAIDASGNARFSFYRGTPSTSIAYDYSISNSQIWATSSGANGLAQPGAVRVDSSGNSWNVNLLMSNSNSVSVFTSSGSALYDITGNGLNNPKFLAFDSSGRAWVANGGGSLSVFTSSGSASSNITGNGLNNPGGIEIDGSGNAWVVNQGNDTVSVFTNGGAAKFLLTGNGLSGVTTLGVDGRGDVWIVNSNSNTVSEFVGVATPVITPLAASLSTPATRP